MPTLQAIRRAATALLDDGGVYGVGSAASTTVATLAIADSSTSASAHKYNGAWLYLASGTGIGQVRRVKYGGFAPATGEITVSLLWSTVPTAQDELEITRLFACASGLGTGVPPENNDYRTMIRRALAQLSVPDRVTLPITTSETYSLSTYAAWLDRPERLIEVYEPAPTGSRIVSARWRGGRIAFDGGIPTLELDTPFTSASGSLTLEVMRPGHTLVNGAESTVGPAAETDTVIPSIDDVLPGVLEQAYQALSIRNRGTPEGVNYDRLRAEMREVFRAGRYYDRSLQMPQQPAEAA